MKTLILTAIRCSLILLIPSVAYATSAQWDLDPISGDWNTADNWTPMGVPNGPTDFAIFGLSNTTDVSISTNTEVNGVIFTPAATNPYNITASPGLTLTISGVGIVNISGRTQAFLTVADRDGENVGTIAFSNHATAGSGVSIFNDGSTNFFNSSTAGGAIISNFRGTTNFFNNSTAGNSVITGEESNVQFLDNSTAGSASIQLDFNCDLNFANNSAAANSHITGVHSSVRFLDHSSAGSASIGVFDFGSVNFASNSTAGSASISARDFGFILFLDSSRGGTAQINLFFFENGSEFLPSYLDISGHNAPGRDDRLTRGGLGGGRCFC
jgi:hypothetical protein